MDKRTATLLLRRAVDQGLLDDLALNEIKRASPAERAHTLLEKLRATGVGADGLEWMVRAADSATRTPEIPGYRIGSLIGWGAAGGVWSAVQEKIEREVALKVIPFGRHADAAGFIAEVHTLGHLNNPHVVICHEAGTTADKIFVAMEMMRGGDVERMRRAAGGRLAETQALQIIRDAALGLCAISEAGLVHRDLKPANLLLTEDGRAKIGDLGLARPSGPAHGASWAVQGTPAYWSPEQVRGQALDVRSDIHALGATLFTLLCGQTPFKGKTILELIRAIGEQPVADPITLCPDMSDGTRSILLTTLAKDPALRHPTAAALAEDLEAVIHNQTPQHARALRLQAFSQTKSHAKKVSTLHDELPAVEKKPLVPHEFAALPATAIIGVMLFIGIIAGTTMGGPSSAENHALSVARAAASIENWTAFVERFPKSDNIAEARTSIKILSQPVGQINQPGPSLELVRLRAELRALDEEWLVLNKNNLVTPSLTTKPDLNKTQIQSPKTNAVETTTRPQTTTKPVEKPAEKPAEKALPPPHDVSLKKPFEKYEPSNSTQIKSLTATELATFTIEKNATRADADAFIGRVAKTIPVGNFSWMRTDNRVDALARIPAKQLPSLIEALKTYPSGPMSSFLELAISEVAQPDQADLVLPILKEYPPLITCVEKNNWQKQAKPIILEWFKERKDNRYIGVVAKFVRALVVNPDPNDYPLLLQIFLKSEYGYWQRDIYYELEKVPGLKLDSAIATLWTREANYRGWEAFAPIAAQYGHADALAAVVLRVPEHGVSHLRSDQARAWLKKFTDSPVDPKGSAAWLAAEPVYDAQLRQWRAKK